MVRFIDILRCAVARALWLHRFLKQRGLFRLED